MHDCGSFLEIFSNRWDGDVCSDEDGGEDVLLGWALSFAEGYKSCRWDSLPISVGTCTAGICHILLEVPRTTRSWMLWSYMSSLLSGI